ncbi:phospholipase B1 membrane-associated [Ecytonucleospora hepatopenaei]|uniref:Phospholipase B1 membrane-associated n=1 Tax=Ecytonucleospora hepatopenaei TaxID=646526 RepID=A0A1W0E8L5_9MICR|nr:phospholipase B1 membrane-associated [Ecytonucleospora hepatopenaei]
MIFTPTSLKLLLDFKTSTEHLPSIELLSSLLDNKLSINLKSLYFILYAHTKKEYFLTNEEVEEVGLKKLKTETEVFLQNKTLIENNPCILRIPFEDKVFISLKKNMRIYELKH